MKVFVLDPLGLVWWGVYRLRPYNLADVLWMAALGVPAAVLGALLACRKLWAFFEQDPNDVFGSVT